jgi:hypothetical protein
MFFKWSDLGSDVHVTEAEVADAYNVCNQIKSAFSTKIASISVDNAASKVAQRVAKKLNADGDPALPLRDPAHCIDLLSKDLAKTSVVRSVLAEAKEVFELCRTNRIDNIRKESIGAGEIPDTIAAQNVVETRMNLTYIHLSSALAQSTFIASLPTNDSYKKYYEERTSAKKQELDTILQNCNHGRWQRMQMLMDLTKVFFDAHKLCSRQDAPLSCYILIVKAIKNTVDRIINGDNGKFDRVLGAGSAKEIADVIGCRFNMDGTKPPGSKVGLIDEYHIWSFLMDPFSYEWRITFILDGALIRKCAKNMIDHFVPADGTRKNDIVRNDLLSEFEVRSALAVKFGFRVRTHPN